MRSLLSFLSVQGGAQIRWVGLGYGSLLRLDGVLLFCSGMCYSVFVKGFLRCSPLRTALQAPAAGRVARGREAGALEGSTGWLVPLASGGGRRSVLQAAAHRSPADPAQWRARSRHPGEPGSGRRPGGAAGAVAAERGHLRRGQGGRGLKVGKEEADRRAGGRAPWPGGVTAREPGEVELGGGAGRGEGGRRGEGGGAGSVFGAPRQRGWRLPVRAGRCVCALLRSGRKMAQKGKLG